VGTIIRNPDPSDIVTSPARLTIEMHDDSPGIDLNQRFITADVSFLLSDNIGESDITYGQLLEAWQAFAASIIPHAAGEGMTHASVGVGYERTETVTFGGNYGADATDDLPTPPAS
jgi:hypothetical protein